MTSKKRHSEAKSLGGLADGPRDLARKPRGLSRLPPRTAPATGGSERVIACPAAGRGSRA